MSITFRSMQSMFVWVAVAMIANTYVMIIIKFQQKVATVKQGWVTMQCTIKKIIVFL